MRLAFARFSHETHALSPIPTELEAFERFHWRRGADLLEGCKPWRRETSQRALYNAELSGMYAAARLARDIELVPLTSAWAIPSGKLSLHAYQHLSDELIAHLQAAGPVDGMLLVLHGAMGVHGEADPEGALLERVREQIGDVPLAVIYDLHAILTPSKVDPVDLLAAYRTNPHRDHFAIGFRTTRQLLAMLRGGPRPVTAWRSLPMVVGGAPTIDVLPPMRSIYRRMRAMEKRPGVVTVSLFQSQLWHDSPQAGWAVVVQTDGDAGLAERLADELAERLWDTRHDLPDDLHPADHAIEVARRSRWARRLGVVVMADVSDAVGCGSVGENTLLLERLLHATDLVSFVPIRDTEAVQAFWASDDDRFSMPVGGRWAPEWCAPLQLDGTIAARVDTGIWGRALVVDCGHVQVVVTEYSPMTVSPGFYRRVGLEPRDADIVVAKSLFLFRLYFLRENRKTVYAKTRGMTDLDVWRFIDYDRPVHPKDVVEDWREGDRIRRSQSGPEALSVPDGPVLA